MSELIPRGGTCRECDTYVLWGDVVRGAYRRLQAVIPQDDNEELAQNTDETTASDVPCSSTKAELKAPHIKTKAKSKTTKVTTTGSRSAALLPPGRKTSKPKGHSKKALKSDLGKRSLHTVPAKQVAYAHIRSRPVC